MISFHSYFDSRLNNVLLTYLDIRFNELWLHGGHLWSYVSRNRTLANGICIYYFQAWDLKWYQHHRNGLYILLKMSLFTPSTVFRYIIVFLLGLKIPWSENNLVFNLTNLRIQGKQRMSSHGDLMEAQQWGSPPNPSFDPLHYYPPLSFPISENT